MTSRIKKFFGDVCNPWPPPQVTAGVIMRGLVYHVPVNNSMPISKSHSHWVGYRIRCLAKDFAGIWKIRAMENPFGVAGIRPQR
jgi:hypothetical protein